MVIYIHRIKDLNGLLIRMLRATWIYKHNLLKADETERDATRRQDEANMVQDEQQIQIMQGDELLEPPAGL